MNHRLPLLLSILLTVAPVLSAQSVDSAAVARQAVLAEAQYLKSIYKTDEAIARLSTLVVPEQFDEEVLSALADCHFQNGDYEKAAGTYFLLAARAPQNPLYKIKQMQTAFRMKAYRQSAEAGKEVLVLDSIPAVAAFVGDAFNLNNQPDSALSYYRQALALKPNNESVVSKVANLLLAAKDYDGVLALTEDYLALDPDNPTVAPIRGLAFYLGGNYEAAQEVFQRLEDQGQESYPIHYYLGQSYWHTDYTYKAEQELLKAWALDSTDANLAWTIAAVQIEMRRSFDRSGKPWLDKAAEMIRPDSSFVSRIYQQYGAGYYREERYEEAIPYYKEAYRYNPSYIQALSTIAYSYERLKKYRQALEYYELYLKVARPGSRGYEFAKKSVDFLKGELFMEEK